RRDDGARGALTNALGPARGGETKIASGDRDDATEDERFRKPLNEITGDVSQDESVGRDLFPDGAPIERGRDVDDELRDDIAADDADQVVDDRENGKHDQRREHARSDELLDGVSAQRVEGVDLLGDALRAQLRGNTGP